MFKKILLWLFLFLIVVPTIMYFLTADQRESERKRYEQLKIEVNRPPSPEKIEANRIARAKQAQRNALIKAKKARNAEAAKQTKAANQEKTIENCKKLGTIAYAAMSAKQQGYSRLWIMNGVVDYLGTTQLNPAVPQVVDLAFTAENQDPTRFGRKVLGDCLVGKYGTRETMF